MCVIFVNSPVWYIFTDFQLICSTFHDPPQNHNRKKTPWLLGKKVPGADPVPGIQQNEGATKKAHTTCFLFFCHSKGTGRIHQESTLEWCWVVFFFVFFLGGRGCVFLFHVNHFVMIFFYEKRSSEVRDMKTRGGWICWCGVPINGSWPFCGTTRSCEWGFDFDARYHEALLWWCHVLFLSVLATCPGTQKNFTGVCPEIFHHGHIFWPPSFWRDLSWGYNPRGLGCSAGEPAVFPGGETLWKCL